MSANIKKIENGSSLVELIFVLPFLFLFFFGVLEITKYLTVAQIVNVVSQESAFRAYRACGDYTIYNRDFSGDLVLTSGAPTLNLTAIQAATNTCANRIRTTLRNDINQFINKNAETVSDITLSIYRFTPPGDTDPSCTSQGVVRIIPSSASNSLFSLSGSSIIKTANSRNLVPGVFIREGNYSVKQPVLGATPATSLGQCLGRQRVVISEVRYNWTKLGPFFGPKVGGGVGEILNLFSPGKLVELRETTVL